MFEDFDEEQSLRDFFEAQQRKLSDKNQETYEEQLHEFMKEIEEDVPTQLEIEKYQNEVETSEDTINESSLDSLVSITQTQLYAAERFLYERQLNFLMADVVSAHETRELSRYTNEMADSDPHRYAQVQFHLKGLEDLDIEELQALSDAISQGRPVIFSEATKRYINSVFADESKMMAREALAEAEMQHKELYVFTDRVLEKTLAESPAEHHPLIQEKFDAAYEAVVDNWTDIEQRTDQIDSIKSRDFFRVIPTGFDDIDNVSPTTHFDSDLLGNQPNYDRLEYLRSFQKYGYPIEFRSYEVEADLVFEQKPEDLRSLIDRINFYSEDLWVTDFNDLPIERHDESEELSRLLTFDDDCGEREAWRLKSLIETNEITDQKPEIEPSQLKERRDDELER